MMKKKRSIGIIVVSTIVFLFPLILNLLFILTYKLLLEQWSLLGIFEWNLLICLSYIFYFILGIGLFQLNNKIRIVTVAWESVIVLAIPLGIIIGKLFIDKTIHEEVVNRYGMYLVEIVPVVMVVPAWLLCISIVFYLTRPKVKAIFSPPKPST